jgi:hypothetical protein
MGERKGGVGKILDREHVAGIVSFILKSVPIFFLWGFLRTSTYKTSV